jgi:hypothetical protein
MLGAAPKGAFPAFALPYNSRSKRFDGASELSEQGSSVRLKACTPLQGKPTLARSVLEPSPF